MKSPYVRSVAFILASLFNASVCSATVPSTVMIEGVMSSAGGGAVADGSYELTLRLFESETSKQAVWAEGPVNVQVKAGRFNYGLGTKKTLEAKQLSSMQQTWLSVSVGKDPELARQRLHAAPFALVAALATELACTGCISGAQLANNIIDANKVGFTYAASVTKGGPASDLSCTGCVSIKELKFDDDMNLGGQSLKAQNAIFTGDIAAASVTAAKFIGDGSALTGINTPSGLCKSGQVVSGIKADGSLICVAGTLSAASLPADGLNEISNNLLSNQFVDAFESKQTNVPIPDNQGVEAISNLIFPDIGLAQQLDITVEIATTDLSGISLTLLPPDDKKTGWVLCDPCGKKDAKSLKTVYNLINKPQSGDITAWIGKNPKGLWNLKAKDTKFCVPQAPGNSKLCNPTAKTDGQIVAWGMKIETLSNQKVALQGTMIASGLIKSDGGLQLGQGPANCEAATTGTLRWDSKAGLQACAKNVPNQGDATYGWVAAKAQPVIWSGHCNSTAPNNSSWNKYCLNDTEHNTAQDYLSVASSGIVTVKVSGYYRINFWTIQHGYNGKRLRLFVNGSQRAYQHNDDGDQRWHSAQIDQLWPLKKGDTFYIDGYVQSGTRYAYHSGNTNGSHSRMQITYEGPVAN
ncbi:MAG: hypothetical protein CMH53_10475 [Myxococcales bacterium]|nr:hypothetical protein [Myxococcales bacterium]